MLCTAHVEVQHGIFVPLRLQLLDGEAFEQFAAPLEIAAEGGHKQRLAETARAAQKVIFGFRVC